MVTVPSRSKGVDLIGDVHGCALTLISLLETLGYQKKNGVYRHPTRTVLFLGDVVDRGPRIREALHIVRDMVDAGAAQMLMGNHEYNVLCYSTRSRPGSDHPYLREHSPRHTRLVKETLEQFANYSSEWHEFLEWFYTLPLFIESDRFRAVHACWDCELIDTFREKYQSSCIDEDFLHASVVKDSFAGQVMDRLLRGTDMRLPDGEVIVGKDGLSRKFFRTKFWSDEPRTYQDIVFQPDPLPETLVNRRLSAIERRQLLKYDADQLPVFVGHYWMSGTPAPITPNIACLDYSAVKYGKLAAYRMDGERFLDKNKFVWVDVIRQECVPIA
ncbi:MAG: metallophosphoesterase [Hahellaceae bacterium]|nr:metallophosphoesterase [Hahellaceae bacterium]